LTPILLIRSIGVMTQISRYQRGPRSKQWVHWCEVCGIVFRSSRVTAQFCGNAHKLKANRHFHKTGLRLPKHVNSLQGAIAAWKYDLPNLTRKK
jgi:hypothetical protein